MARNMKERTTVLTIHFRTPAEQVERMKVLLEDWLAKERRKEERL